MDDQETTENERHDVLPMTEQSGESFKTSVLSPALTEAAVADVIDRRDKESLDKAYKNLEHCHAVINDLMKQNASLTETIGYMIRSGNSQDQKDIINTDGKPMFKKTEGKKRDRNASICFSDDESPSPKFVKFDHAAKDKIIASTSAAAKKADEKAIEHEWRNLADKEIDEGRKNGYGGRHGTHAILCIDTSGSMREGNAWSQVKQFYNDYLDGMEQLKDQDAHHDNIAVVTFGEETKVRQRLTKNLNSLRGLLDDIKPSGPSPIFGGLIMAGAAAKTSKFSFAMVNNLLVIPKLILVTDGKPTELTLLEGPDVADPELMELTKSVISDEADKLAKDQIDLHCIYVGQNADRSFLKRIQSKNVKDLMSYRDGERMALYTVVKCMKEGDQRFVRCAGLEGMGNLGMPDMEQLSSLVNKMSDDLPGINPQLTSLLLKSIISSRDKSPDKSTTDLQLTSRSHYKTSTITMAGDRLINVYKEINDGQHPAIGTRVEKGSDWTWGNQNRDKDGTIIGHADDPNDDGQCWVHVEWDDDNCPEKGIQNVYRYKMDDDMEGDVREAASDDRLPPAGKVLAVGCRVKQGEGYRGEKTDVKGSVIRFHGNRVEVRWDDGNRGKYRFGTRSSEVVPLMDPGRTAFEPARQDPGGNNMVCEDGNDVPKIRVNDKHALQIAQTIPSGWEMLGTELDVGNVKMNHIAKDNQSSIVMQIYAMLNYWRQNAENPTLDVLVKAIRGCGVTYDADGLSEIIEAARKEEKK